jgi:hypothetical protein
MLRKAPSLGRDIDNVSSWLVLALVLSTVEIRPLEESEFGISPISWQEERGVFEQQLRGTSNWRPCSRQA